ncbi:MAG: efflux RND transporter periplasmic adaptor subunit [Gammaproteobacteria bacterium]|nr:efflux RND transporter periplasmic adaptor subunit [Gammaproteobacteria bacterium]
MRILLVFGIPILAVIAAVGMMSLKEKPPEKERVELDPLVDVLVLEAITTQFEVRSQGTVRPRTETILSAEVSGTITSISPKFIAGGVFGANEVLMRIDPTNYRVALDQAEALVAQRQIEYDGARKLKSQGYRAETEYASAVAALASANAEEVRARRNLERTYIRLPYAGMVRAKDSDIGQFVNPGTRLGVTFATDFAEVRLPLTDLDLAFIELPGAADMTDSGDALGPVVELSAVRKGQMTKWPARIVRTEGVVDESSRVTYAVARIDDPYRLRSDGTALPIGTFVTASIEGASVPGLHRAPNAAVRGANQLLVVDAANALHLRNVEVVRADAEFTYFRGALDGERIVVSALEAPIEGMRVRTPADVAESSSKLATVDEGDKE